MDQHGSTVTKKNMLQNIELCTQRHQQQPVNPNIFRSSTHKADLKEPPTVQVLLASTAGSSPYSVCANLKESESISRFVPFFPLYAELAFSVNVAKCCKVSMVYSHSIGLAYLQACQRLLHKHRVNDLIESVAKQLRPIVF